MMIWTIYLISLGVCAFNVMTALADFSETGESPISIGLVPGLAGFTVFPVINTVLAVISTYLILKNGGYFK